MGRIRDAIASYDRALAMNEDMTSALVGRAQAHRAMGNVEAAKRDLDRAVELDPATAWIRVHRASALLALGKREDALADLSHCIENECQEGSPAYNHAARAILGHLSAGDHVQALAELDTAFDVADKRSDVVEVALWGLALAAAVEGEGDRTKWAARLEPKGDRFSDRIAKVVRGELDPDAVLADVPIERKCRAVLSVGVREQLAGRPGEAQKRFAEAASVVRSAELSCVLAGVLETFEAQ